jgi:hypothetical protein
MCVKCGGLGWYIIHEPSMRWNLCECAIQRDKRVKAEKENAKRVKDAHGDY